MDTEQLPPLPSQVPTRKLWVRVLLMLLMGAIFQLACAVLGGVAVVQLLIVVATGEANERIRSFGISLGRYLAQIAEFESFGTQELPFPFADWPRPR